MTEARYAASAARCWYPSTAVVCVGADASDADFAVAAGLAVATAMEVIRAGRAVGAVARNGVLADGAARAASPVSPALIRDAYVGRRPGVRIHIRAEAGLRPQAGVGSSVIGREQAGDEGTDGR